MNHKKGFTLIELAIVIVIAAILSAVAVPIYQGYVKDSKWSEANMSIGSFVSGMRVYYAYNSNSFAAIESSGSWAKISVIAIDIGILPESLQSLRYFDSDDFVYCIDSNNNYAVACLADLGAGGGSSKNGPNEGHMVFDSNTGWDDSITQTLLPPY